MNKKQALEGLLFLSGEKGISLAELILYLELGSEEIIKMIDDLEKKYEADDSAIKLLKTAQNYKLVTKTDCYDIYKRYANNEFNDRLSNSALETLAIIAYNQPVTRYYVDEIRGVSTSHHFKTLINKELISVIGKSEEIGRPNLYGTTSKFLDYLGINDLNELTPLENFELKQESFALFKEEIDVKELRKHLLDDSNIVKKVEDIEFNELDEIEIPEIKYLQKEEEEDGIN